jgi:predicted  nucleic acid-binding Zn-ribbon protein
MRAIGVDGITNPGCAANKSPELLPIPVSPMDDWANGDPVARQRVRWHRLADPHRRAVDEADPRATSRSTVASEDSSQVLDMTFVSVDVDLIVAPEP